MPEFPVQEFQALQLQRLAEGCQAYPAMSNNASALGHACERYLVYKRTRGEEEEPISPRVKAIFQEGIVQEDQAIQIIKEMGYHYERSQESFGIKDLQIRGKMDGVTIARSNGRASAKWASEIKSVNEHTFERLNRAEDFLGSVWYEKWYVQLQLAIYHVATKQGFDDAGVMWLKNKCARVVKPISMPYDEKVLDIAFKKAASINQHMSAGTLPKRLPWTQGMCADCGFRAICLPEEEFKAQPVIEDPKFIGDLKRWEMLKDSKSEYDKLDKHIKAVLRGKEAVIAGPFSITGKKYGADGWKVDIARTMSDQDVQTVQEATKDQSSAVSEAAVKLVEAMQGSKTMDELNKLKATIKAQAKDFTEVEKDYLQSFFKVHVKRLRVKGGEPA